MYYIHKDYLGSYETATNDYGQVVEKLGFDPWLAYFLSPDNFVQTPEYSQNFNRYSYALNNPLKYTDPSGEFLTWSPNDGGFSNGLNFTPVDVPLGFGLNFGWADSFSIGVYGEIGPRVGGAAGFGSDVTLQQSLDYNFKYHGWSITTTESAYVSIGIFNTGVYSFQNYDLSNNQRAYDWCINAGIEFGNDAIGIGFNIGCSSNGFVNGIGGYWSQKHGSGLVTNVDGANHLIRNPARANHFYGIYFNGILIIREEVYLYG